jgi:hypothetical protein
MLNSDLRYIEGIPLVNAILELALFVLLALTMKAACQAARDYSTARSTTGLLIALPSVVGGMAVIKLLIGVILKNTVSAPPRFVQPSQLYEYNG